MTQDLSESMNPKGSIQQVVTDLFFHQHCHLHQSLKDYLFNEEIGLQSVTGVLALLLCTVF